MTSKLAALALSVVIGAGFPVLTLAQTAAQPGSAGASERELSQRDRNFLNYAAEDNQGEIQIAILAEKSASNFAVKAFARLMIDDHAEVESRLAALTNRLNVKVPIGIGQENQQILRRLEPLSGAAFDHAFIQAQIQDHSDDIKRFRQEEAATHNLEVRQFVAETIPILEQHVQLAEAVEKSLGAESVGSSGQHPGGLERAGSQR